jgi:hypothetical protein
VRGNKRSGRAVAAAVLAAFACAAILAPGAGATVPPKNCGTITVKSKRYQIKADQMRCTTAKTYSRRYLRSHSRPSGYSCRDYSSSTKLKFRCSKRVRVFFAIRR